MTIYRGPGGSGDATNDATVTAVAAYASQAATSAENAATSASTASTASTSAASSATAAAGSASNAASSASNAATSATNAAASASAAATSATSAASQVTAATTQANNAATSATAAATSAANAATSATAAQTAETNAETAETNAETAYANTLAIFGSAAAVTAAVSAASTSATNAANSATAASTSATNAANSASSASNFASAALNSANTANAEASEAQEAANTAVAALQEAQEIYTGIDVINTAVTSATNSATNAGISAGQASTSASNAATSATNAANSATQAANSAASAAAIVTGVASNRPSIRPSLLLDFQYTKQLDPRITFSRPTTATYYDGKTVVKAEENLVIASENINDSNWSIVNNVSKAVNTTTAPDGNSTADTLYESAATGTHYTASGLISFTSGLSYTFSFFAKNISGGRGYINIIAYGPFPAGSYAQFNLNTGAVGTTSGMTASIVSVGNGWYRCIATITATSSSSERFYYYLSDGTNSQLPSYAGDVTKGIYIWGAQLEQRSTVTAYTPTTTAPITNYIPALQTAVSNDARFDHDPVTGESKGLLIEEQRTNLLTYSEQFDNAAWAKNACSVSAASNISPYGTQTAQRLTEDTTTAIHRVQQNYTTTAVATTFSCYAKAAERSIVYLNVVDVSGSVKYAWFNLSNGTVLTVNSGLTANITNVGNGWYRCAISYTGYAGTAPHYIGVTTSDGTVSYTGNGYSGIYIWGAQLEAGSFPTSYIPTVASQVTRSADSASMTGSNFSSWYRADEGTVYAVHSAHISANRAVFAINDGTIKNSMELYTSTASIRGYINNKDTVQMDINAGSPVVGTNQSTLFYKLNDSGADLNGAAVVVDSSCIVPTVDRLTIGFYGTAFGYWCGTIKRIAYYPKRLSNTELQGLTS